MAGVGYVVGGQTYDMDGDMWWSGGMWQGVGACGRVWGNVAGVVAGCGGMWQGWGYVVGGQAYSMDRNMWQEWGHMVGSGACGRLWGHVAGWLQGVGACGRGRVMW